MKSLDTSIYPIYCPPFDDPLLWDGHGTMIDEIVNENQLSQEECDKVKGIVCSVGGGGLYNGIVAGLQRNAQLKDVPILAVETFQTPTFSEALKAGNVVTLDSIDFYDNFGTLVEPACGATISMAFDNNLYLKYFGALSEDDIIILIGCGGAGISTESLNEYRKLYV